MLDAAGNQTVLRSSWRLARLALRQLADFFVPPLCLSCKQPLAQHNTVCAECWRDIHFIVPPLCDRLGIPLPFDPGGGPIVSAAAAANPPPYDHARAVAHYTGTMRDLIHMFKYADQHAPRHLFARLLERAGRELFHDCELVVPVPLSRQKLRARRFNQAALLAHDLARSTRLSYEPQLLQRRKNTVSQVGLTRDQRRRNMQGAFALSKSGTVKVKDRAVLLIDDVITTGTTVEACARALKQAGARHVDVLALALVTNESQIVL
ncbi:MAG: ComF family protein [Pseudomonadota bacterium]